MITTNSLVRLTAGSLFDGIGAFSAGLSKAGIEMRWSVEIESACRRVTAARFPDVRQYEDVRAVGKGNLEVVDLIIGGFPCQNTSLAGKREGLKGEKSGLYWEMLRVIDELRPRYVLWENVPGLSSSDAGRDLLRICCSLGECGYRGVIRNLDTRYFGLAQRRKRLFGLFALLGAGDGRGVGGKAPWQDESGLLSVLAKVLLERSRMSGNTAPSRNKRDETAGGATTGADCGGDRTRKDWPAELAGSIDTNLGTKRGLENQHIQAGSPFFVPQEIPVTEQAAEAVSATRHGRGMELGGDIASAIRSGGDGHTGDQMGYVLAPTDEAREADLSSEPAVAYAIQDCRTIEKAQGGAGIDPSESSVSYTLDSLGQQGVAHSEPIAFYPTGGTRGVSSITDLSPALKIGSGCGIPSNPATAFHCTQDPISDLIAPAISKGSEHGSGSIGVMTNDKSTRKMTIRRLTPTECLRVMGLPDNWLDLTPPLSDSTKYKCVGNSGAPIIIEWIARRIVAIEQWMADGNEIKFPYRLLPLVSDCAMLKIVYPGCAKKSNEGGAE